MVVRTMTLMVSDAPIRKSMMSESAMEWDKPKAMVKTPNPVTHQSMAVPARRLSGQRATARLVRTAPTPGAARRMPRPGAPTFRISRA